MAVLTGNIMSGKFTPRYPLDLSYNQQVADKFDSAQLILTQYPVSATTPTRTGALQITSDRTSGYPLGSSWDGNADQAVRINCYNRAANTISYGGIRGLQVYVRQYSGGNICNMYGALIDADDRGTSSGGSVATIQTAIISQRCNSVVATKSNVLVVQDNSQGTLVPTTCAGTAMVVIESTQPVASGARASAVHFQVTGSGTGWTHAFSFQTAAGKEGFTAIVNGSLKGNVDGYIKVYDVATGATLYINCYDTVPS